MAGYTALVTLILVVLVVLATGCPDNMGCTCDLDAKWMTCGGIHNVTWNELLVQIPNYVEKVSIEDSEFSKEGHPAAVRVLPTLVNVQDLSISNSSIVNLDTAAFSTMPNIRELHLNDVKMTNSMLYHLSVYSSVEVLDLSHNNLTELPSDLLESWPVLGELNLCHNQFAEFSFHVFHQRSPVHTLDLSHNNISYVHPDSFPNGTSLRTLNLQSNNLHYLHHTIVHNISHSTALHLGDNPWACHCGMDWLVKALKSSEDSLVRYADLREIQCASPQDLKSTCLVDLSPELLLCELPMIESFPDNQTIHYMNSRLLQCNISGYPSPSVYWLTPHGPLVHPSHRYWVPPDVVSSPDHITFSSKPIYFHEVSAVRAQGDGSLLFENYRHYFDGEYTCVAVNPAGSVDNSINVTVTNKLESTILWTVIWGFTCAGGFLFVGIAVGGLLQGIRKFCSETKFIPGPDLKRPELTIVLPDEYYDQYDDYDYDDDYSDESLYYCDYDRSPLHSHQGSPRRSPIKCVTPAVTPAEFHDIDHMFIDVGINIRETLESVRNRLRQNMERHMDRMKSRTQHMHQTSRRYMRSVRSSTGRTMKTLKYTSSQYAHKMREGMVQGVEQVKYHVQSMKELCGPGHMPHTISTVSVSTNVDSNQKKHVFKSITYV